MKAFNKGDLVTYIKNWDRKGTFVYQDFIVYSCGMKEMILTNPVTGEQEGRTFRANREVDMYGNEIFNSGTWPRLSNEKAIEVTLEKAEAFLANEVVRLTRCIENNSEEKGYCDSLQRDLDNHHAPRAISYDDAIAELDKKFAAKRAAQTS